MFHRIFATVALLAIPSLAFAQNKAKVILDDGSAIRCEVVTPSLTVATVYGDLTIPLSEVSRIRLGLHPTPAEAKQLDDAARGLGSAIFRDRELARKSLIGLGRLSIPTLKRAAKTPDREVATMAATLLAEVTERDPREAHDWDTVEAKAFAISGKIRAESLAFRSATLGEITVPLGKIETVTIIGLDNATIMLEAARHGSSLDQWYRTGIHVEVASVLTVKAKGEVDLWPQGAGQYMAKPGGYNTAGKGGQFLAGALIGKIGNGQPFLIGTEYAQAARESGELHLLIVPSPWNNASTGGYSITTKTDR